MNATQLLRQPGAKAFYGVIFLNACVDLGHKITLQNTVFKAHDGPYQVALIAVINALILLPYVTLFYPIGRVADQLPKPRLIQLAASCAGLLCMGLFVFYTLGWFWPAMAMTLLMAVQSAFYSPAKLGYLRTLFGVDRLSIANGLSQTVVIVGILFGTLAFSLGFETLYANFEATQGQTTELSGLRFEKDLLIKQMAPLGWVLLVLALIQLLLAYRIPIVAEQNDNSLIKDVTDANGLR